MVAPNFIPFQEILIVDDDRGVLFLHELLVQESQLHPSPICFTKPNEALHWMETRKEHPYLIFLDINMPGMDAWQFLQIMGKSQHHHNTRVIIVSSSLNSEDRLRATKFPIIIDYVEKPLSLEYCENLKKDKLS